MGEFYQEYANNYLPVGVAQQPNAHILDALNKMEFCIAGNWYKWKDMDKYQKIKKAKAKVQIFSACNEQEKLENWIGILAWLETSDT